ncbi:MAG: hypothetical protein JWR05_1933 [Mucilaginibacter sp.]|nr:hypothetical protein [Mucilaginibacter sp.]
MKKYYLIYTIFISIVVGCNEPASTKQNIDISDIRPKHQINFIKKLKVADSLYTYESNEIKKAEALDSNKIYIAHYVIDSLKCQIINWHAYIYEMKVNEWPTKNIEVTMMIPNDMIPDKEFPQYNAVILRSIVPFDDIKIKKLLKDFQNNDKVLISGNFENNDLREVNYNFYSSESKIFSNPRFEFKITDIRSN